MNLFILLGVVSHFSLIYCSSACEELKTCGACIGHAAERCVWCAQDTMNIILSKRCISQKETSDEWCPSDKIKDPVSKPVEIVENEPFSATEGKEIQFIPQKIKLKLRPGIPVSFDMSYQPAKNYPLDMYFLMDNSQTMQDYAALLSNQTLEINDALKAMTNNVRLGLGSYVEKSGLPYSDIRLKPTYAFKHHLSLTEDTILFKDIVLKYSEHYGSNFDSPEATLDALMQIMKCQEKIGWAKRSRGTTEEEIQARRIIIVATDSTYHSAGDGRAIGAFKPNDMKCYLDPYGDSEWIYNDEKARTLDYPSVSQIKHVAKENNMIIVFTVLKRVLEDYKDLAEEIGGKFAELTAKQIVPVIKEAYIKASRDVKLNVMGQPPSIDIKTTCDENPKKCVSTEANPAVVITATVTAKDCKSGLSFDIIPFGIKDKLTVEVEVDCTCDCENKDANKSLECSLFGKKQCGVCICDADRSGETCETKCSGEDASKNKYMCNQNTGDLTYCNGRGKCVCGKCECYTDNGQSYSGKYCEHDDTLCRETCPADRGDCILGQCVCKKDSGWTGPDCNCTVSVNKCIGPFSKEPCSGRGNCVCGKCSCAPIDGKDYFGSYCEKCKDCAKKLCEQLKDYAFCNFEKNTKADCDARYNQTSVQDVIFMNKTGIEAVTSATGCKKDVSGKILIYKYIIIRDDMDMAKIKLIIQDELESPPVANIWITIGSVIGGVLLVGLLTLIIWKISTNIYDKREYDKFCQQSRDQGFDVTNPTYIDPCVNIVNPAYRPDCG